MTRSFLILFSFLIIIVVSFKAQATHFRGGEITTEASSGSSLTYKIKIIVYSDPHSPVASSGTVNFGDGSASRDLLDILASHETEHIGDHITKNIYTINHTFPSTGTFIINFTEFNRNPNAVNLLNSVNTPYYLESQVVIDPYFGANKSPKFTAPPLFTASVGVKYVENPMAEDADGDSLAYRLVTPLQDLDVEVGEYQLPHLITEPHDAAANEDGTGRPSFTINQVTGDLVWDAPVVAGYYFIAYIIEEWRKIEGEWYQLGYTLRDYQVTVEDVENNRPYLEIPADTIFKAGEILSATITGHDPDGDEITIESSGAPYNFATLPAEYAQQGNELNFTWQTDPEHISNQPYEVVFRVFDHPEDGPVLYDYKTWRIIVSDLTNQKKILQKEPLLIYPNPTTGIINIENFLEENGPTHITVYDQFGRLILSNSYQTPNKNYLLNLEGK
ncbi:hypothetical protein BH23BAC1_BH23BAC1_28770 [soil metagenome]